VFKADITDPQVAAELKKKRTFRTFSYRGVELEKLLDMNTEDVCLVEVIPEFPFNFVFGFLVCRRAHPIVDHNTTLFMLTTFQLVHARARRRFQRGLKKRPMGLIKKLRKAKKEAPPNEKPAVVKTHLRDMIIVPEMIGSVVGIYNGKVSFFVPSQNATVKNT
jgi:ribosomal protein S19